MKCPHCKTDFFASFASTHLNALNNPTMKGGVFDNKSIVFRIKMTTCPACKGATIDLEISSATSGQIYQNLRVLPRGGMFISAPSEVPAVIARDYEEANEVLAISPKASAALARRCLQAVLSSHGYAGRDLVKQISAVLSETDTGKSLPTALRENIDAIRNFGNFSAHPITDITTFQVIEVEEGEAEWCLQILLDLFDHFYVSPARAAERRAALAEKLSAAGKPAMK